MNAALPNLLTATRLVAVPVLVVMMLADGGDQGWMRWWALLVFLVAAGTDFLDGYLARRWGVVSSFGKLADPIADKALILAALVMLVVIDDLVWWPIAVLAVREVAITAGRLAVAADAVIPASPGGKLKTALQLAAVTFFLVPNGPMWLDTTAWWCLIAAVVVALVTAIHYSMSIRRVWRTSRAVSPQSQRGQEGADAVS